jgi:hypothetical protein
MVSPSSLTRESMTCVSGDEQNGHFIGFREVQGERSGASMLKQNAA